MAVFNFLIFSLSLASASFVSQAHGLPGDFEICNAVLHGSKTETFSEFPRHNGQTVQVMRVLSRSKDGTEEFWLGGVELAMQGVDPISVKSKPIFDQILGKSTNEFETSGSISGSAARYGIFEAANDLDYEGQIIVRTSGGSVDELFDSKSPHIARIARYLQAHVEDVLARNPSYRFIEMKAGEFLDPATHTIEGIKWWREDLARGYRMVTESSGTRKVTLEQVLAEPARIKLDWAVPAVIDPLNALDYTEASIVYRLGMRVEGRPARLRVSKDPSKNEGLPVRPTSIALSKEDLKASLELSQNEKSVAIESIHQSLIKTIEKYAYKDRLKVVRRVFALLSFWENSYDYAAFTNRPVTTAALLGQFRAIMVHPKNIIYSRIRARAEARLIAQEHKLTLPTSDADWLRLVKSEHQVSANTLEALIDEMSEKIEKELSGLFSDYPEVPLFIEFVRNRAQYLVSNSGGHYQAFPLSQNPIFVSLKPNTEFRTRIETRMKEWKVRYPALRFHKLEDLHMTLRFSGRLTEKAVNRLNDEIGLQIKGASGKTLSELSAHEGKLTVFGRNNQLIAIKFGQDVTLSRIAQTFLKRSSEVGGVPEKKFFDFTPHITLAEIRNPASRRAQAQIEAFLREAAAELSDVKFEELELLTRSRDGKGYEKVGVSTFQKTRD